MTTIAFKDGVMAADSQATAYNTAFRVQKVWRLPDGGVVAITGDAAKGWAGAKWLMDGEEGDPPELGDAALIIARPDGTLWLAEGQFPAFPTLAKEFAHGCGRDFALAALADGKSAVEAVFAAARQDVMTSGPVMSMRVIPRDFPPVEIHQAPEQTRAKRSRRAR